MRKHESFLTLPSRELALHLTESVRGVLPTTGASHPRPLVALSARHLDEPAPLRLAHAAATTGAGAAAGEEDTRKSAVSGGAAAMARCPALD